MRVETLTLYDPLAHDPRRRDIMLPENYSPRDWTNGEIEAAKALWNEHNTDRSWQRLQPEKSAGTGAWMIYLNDPRISLNVSESYA
jgi:hypothetical protein